MSDLSILIIEATTKTKPLCENFSDTSIVHCRNSLILKNFLNADLLDGEYKLDYITSKKYDVIICCYASPYMPHIPYRKVLDLNPDARLIWLVNDHDLEDNQLLRWAVTERGRSYDMICNNPREGYRHWILGKNIMGKKLNDFIINWHTCNLNSLVFNVQSEVKNEKNGFIYYGTYRKHRIDDFKKYLNEGLILSSSTKHWKKYDSIGCKCEMIKPLKWSKGNEDLRNYKYSLYIEDKHTHENYAFMANRFYEALMCDVVTLFAPNTLSTFNKSGYQIDKRCIIPEGCYGESLNEYVSSLDFDDLLNNQKNLITSIIFEKQRVLNGIKDFIYLS
jgi:hypothetical protein